MAKDDYIVIPPVLNVTVEDSMDIMIARDTARRAAALLGFAPAFRAQLAGAAGALAELVLKTGTTHVIEFNGVQVGGKTGIQISCEALWLAEAASANVEMALRAKLGDLVDDIQLVGDAPPTIFLTMWLSSPREMKSFDTAEPD
ncbi:MAG: hypothetical protein JXN59_07530 [Anaerolineae bacterium]|nr:hypothetical protein [Anaerolineae bacterium]